MYKLVLCVLYFFLQIPIYANDKAININFNNLSIQELIKITSRITKRNILITKKIEGEVDFISQTPLTKEELLDLLIKVLNSKDFTLIEDGNILKIVPQEEKKQIVDKKIVISRVTKIIRLKNLKSKKIMPIINKVISSYKNKPIVSYEHESNNVIIIGNKNEVNELTELINKLDIRKIQIFVEARIIEISEIKTKNLGVKYGLSGGQLSGSSLFTFASSLNEGSSIVLDSSIKDFTPLGSMSVFALGATINLLKENLALEIVSEPSILCLDNQESSIYVGETRSIKIGTTTTSGGNINDSYTREDIGLKLSVTPRVMGNEILLEIQTVLEDIKQSKTLSGNPITLKKEIKTTAIVKNSESIILGGLIKNKIDFASENIPLLSDIPILGNLFKNQKRIKDKVNLVIIITPHIIHKNEDLTFIRNKLAKLKLLEGEYTRLLKNSLEKRISKPKYKVDNFDLRNNLMH